MFRTKKTKRRTSVLDGAASASASRRRTNRGVIPAAASRAGRACVRRMEAISNAIRAGVEWGVSICRRRVGGGVWAGIGRGRACDYGLRDFDDRGVYCSEIRLADKITIYRELTKTVRPAYRQTVAGDPDVERIKARYARRYESQLLARMVDRIDNH